MVVPEADLLIKVATDDGAAGSVCRHDVVAAAARELGLSAAVTAQVPDLECPIVAARHCLGVAQEFGRHHLCTVARQRVLQHGRKRWVRSCHWVSAVNTRGG